MRVADVRLKWQKSVSADVASVDLAVTINGEQTFVTLGPEVESYDIEVAASGSVSFSGTVTDSEGNVTSSVTYSFSLGDLVAPQPITGLGFEVIAIRDVEDVPPASPAE
jgi:hypothetical protein